MTTLRNIRELLTEAVHELWAAADFLIRKADDRWILGKEEEK